MKRVSVFVIGLIAAGATLFVGPGVALAAPTYGVSVMAPMVADDYPVTPGDSSGYPIKSCSGINDGENVSTITYDINTNTAYTRQFTCKNAEPDIFGNGGGFVWFEIVLA